MPKRPKESLVRHAGCSFFLSFTCHMCTASGHHMQLRNSSKFTICFFVLHRQHWDFVVYATLVPFVVVTIHGAAILTLCIVVTVCIVVHSVPLVVTICAQDYSRYYPVSLPLRPPGFDAPGTPLAPPSLPENILQKISTRYFQRILLFFFLFLRILHKKKRKKKNVAALRRVCLTPRSLRHCRRCTGVCHI